MFLINTHPIKKIFRKSRKTIKWKIKTLFQCLFFGKMVQIVYSESLHHSLLLLKENFSYSISLLLSFLICTPCVIISTKNNYMVCVPVLGSTTLIRTLCSKPVINAVDIHCIQFGPLIPLISYNFFYWMRIEWCCSFIQNIFFPFSKHLV